MMCFSYSAFLQIGNTEVSDKHNCERDILFMFVHANSCKSMEVNKLQFVCLLVATFGCQFVNLENSPDSKSFQFNWAFVTINFQGAVTFGIP